MSAETCKCTGMVKVVTAGVIYIHNYEHREQFHIRTVTADKTQPAAWHSPTSYLVLDKSLAIFLVLIRKVKRPCGDVNVAMETG